MSETWVILPEGCNENDPSNCDSLRGGENFNGQPPQGFLANQSSTWEEIGLYEVEAEKKLNISANGLYGTDVVGVNGGNGTEGGVSLDGQIVAGIAAKEYFLGVLGLSRAPADFSSAAPSRNSFLHNLYISNFIPSLSYSYTAGAKYGSSKLCP